MQITSTHKAGCSFNGDFPQNLAQFLPGNYLILKNSYYVGKFIAEKLTESWDSKISVFSRSSVGDFTALSTKTDTGDCVFLDYDELSLIEDYKRLIFDAVVNNQIELTIGKGTGARTIHLDIPIINYCLFSSAKYGVPDFPDNIFKVID